VVEVMGGGTCPSVRESAPVAKERDGGRSGELPSLSRASQARDQASFLRRLVGRCPPSTLSITTLAMRTTTGETTSTIPPMDPSGRRKTNRPTLPALRTHSGRISSSNSPLKVRLQLDVRFFSTDELTKLLTDSQELQADDRAGDDRLSSLV
jgi:hypothetical protein